VADVQRTLSTLQGVFADNTANDISEQDLRDFLVSAAPNAGHLYVSSSAATTVASSGVWYEAAGTWTLGSARNFSKSADNRLRYDGTPTQLAIVVAHFTLECGSSSQDARVALAKNGTVLNGADAKVFLGTTGSAPGQGCLVALTTVSTNDYLGVFVRNNTAANNLTLAHASIVALGLLN
jgi:hypothetical protein